jgi:hypothetical protein
MPYFTSSEEWQRQSALLLQARPNTVRLHPSPTHLHFPSTEHPANTRSTDPHNNKIPHPLRLLHILEAHTSKYRHRTTHTTNRSPRAKNLRPSLWHNAKIPHRQSCRGGKIDCCNGKSGKGNGCFAAGQGGCGYG